MAASFDSPVTTEIGAFSGKGRRWFIGAPFDAVSHEMVVRSLALSNDSLPFRYVVTPNVDHVVRLSKNPALLPLYADAWLSLCDSRPISLLAHCLSFKLTPVTGSDLTLALFRSVVRRGDIITLIAANADVVSRMEHAFPDLRFRSHIPPPGVWNNTQALQDCVDFVAREPARFALVAIGAPQSEKIAHLLSRDARAHGVGLCIGAGLEFLTGTKKRAPMWMRHLAIEWLHRLASDPRRLWRRYAYSALPLMLLFVKEIETLAKRPRHTDQTGAADNPSSDRTSGE